MIFFSPCIALDNFFCLEEKKTHCKICYYMSCIIVIGVEGLRYSIYILQFYSEIRTSSAVSKHFAYLLKINIHFFFSP